MQIVIDIDEDAYKEIKKIVADGNEMCFMQKLIANGTPLPNIHEMREATHEELESVNNYIKSISKPTGVNIWDKIEEVQIDSGTYDYSTHSYRKGCTYSDRTENGGRK